MSRALTNRREPSSLPGWLVLSCILLFLAGYLLVHRHDLGAAWLEDLPIYQTGLHSFMAGLDPYTHRAGVLYFVYPPIVLYPFSWLARWMPGESEWVLFTCVHIVCVLAAPLLLARFYLRERWFTPALAVLVWLAEPGTAGIRALYSANIAPSLYFAALLAAVPGLQRNRWAWFYLVVLLASMVKITLLVLLLFPLLIGQKQWLQSGFTAAVVIIANKVEQLRMPMLYAHYQDAVLHQLQGLKQYGYSVFGTVAVLEDAMRHGHVGLLSYGAHLVFAGVLVALLFGLKRRGINAFDRLQPESRTVWMGLVIMAAIVVNPRVLHYDMYLALLAAIVVLAICLRCYGWKLLALMLVLFLPGTLPSLHNHPLLMSRTWELLVVVWALAFGIRRLWQETGQFASVGEVEAEPEPLG